VIRVLIVDDHPIVREGLLAVLSDQPDLEVVGAVGSAEEALARDTHPDVVLLDLELPGLDGVAALPLLRDAMPTAAALVLTAYATDERIVGALTGGAAGYLLKGGTPAAAAASSGRRSQGGTPLAEEGRVLACSRHAAACAARSASSAKTRPARKLPLTHLTNASTLPF